MSRSTPIIAVLAALTMAAPPPGQTTRYVDDSASPGGNGLSWSTAYNDLQDALDDALAHPSIEEIRVAGGTYYPSVQSTPGTPQTETFQLVDNVSVVGGYAGMADLGNPDVRDLDAYASILSGDIGVPGESSDNCAAVVTGSDISGVVLDGFTITGGIGPRGAGMCVEGAIPSEYNYTLIDCTFTENHGGGATLVFGGGLYAESNVHLVRCLFHDNSVQAWGPIATRAWGGGMCAGYVLVRLDRCLFLGNAATATTVGIPDLSAWAEAAGGGLAVSDSFVQLLNCAFNGNTTYAQADYSYPYPGQAGSYGGGMYYAESDYGECEAGNCNFVGNAVTASAPGGGTTTRRGGGLFSDGDLCYLSNSIFWDNTAASGAQIYGDPQVRYCCAQGGYSGLGNISSNPALVDADGPDDVYGTLDDNLHLLYYSPCIDAGSNDWSLWLDIQTDIDGQDRFMDSPNISDTGAGTPPIVDMGVDEFGPAVHNVTQDTYHSTIDLAVNLAQNGDLIEVEPGVYHEHVNIDSSGSMITLCSTGGRDVTIIDGYHSESVISFENFIENDMTIDGFTIRHGRGAGGGIYIGAGCGPTIMNCAICDNYAVTNGGGMYNIPLLTSPTVFNCTFSGNQAENHGGAMFNAGTVIVTECTFTDNSATYGGGVCIADSDSVFEDCTFSANIAGLGGGMYNYEGSTPTLTRCTFDDNQAPGGGGGGMFNAECSDAILRECSFTGNSADQSGGGVYNDSSDPILVSCTFIGNEVNNSDGGGGGMSNAYSSPTVANSLFTGNFCAGVGGGMFNYQSAPAVVNCLFTNNQSDDDAGGMFNDTSGPEVTNCIFWGDRTPEIYNHGSPGAVVTYSCVQGGYSGTGNISANPLFVDGGAGDYYLLPASPCIDAGNNAAVPPDAADLDNDSNTSEPTPMDFDGRLRFTDRVATPDTGVGDPAYPGLPIVDMGAYEYQCDGDLNGDGQIGLSDLAQLLAHYGTAGGATYQDGDLDGDGDVDLSDLAALLAVYGTTSP